MKMIPRFYHAVMDYIMGLLLLLAPTLFGFADVGGAAVWVPRIVGLMVLGQALTTDYELGVLQIVPIGMHLMNDYVVGALLIIAPFVLRFSRVSAAMALLVVCGLLVLGLTAMTQPRGRPHEVMA